MEPQLLADGANIREMKIYAVKSLFASVNFLSQGRAFPWPSLHHLHVHKIHYSRTDGAPDSSGRGCGRGHCAPSGAWDGFVVSTFRSASTMYAAWTKHGFSSWHGFQIRGLSRAC